MPQQLFVFIQLEFPWKLGPADGRYLIRRSDDGEPEHVVVLGTLEATGRPIGAPAGAGRGGVWLPRRLRERPRSIPAGPEPAPVSTSRVTVIDPISLSAESQARAWLAELDREREVGAAVTVVNRVIHAHRIAVADPYVHEVAAAQALVIRAGWGEGEQVADGRWLHARGLPWHDGRGAVAGPAAVRRGPGRDRSWALRPQERLAALLGARGAALVCEELALRAREDLDHGRLAHAALELDRALALAVPELHGESRQDLAIRIAELEQLSSGVHAQAELALPGNHAGTDAAGADQPPGALDEEIIAHALRRLEATLRARTAAGL
ncbi:MAG TPA: hypothetical protein VK721_15400 [Solirubrobacteraceae bacterium]|jgi:hypothetical protein|nr:hypothetical protein [Solirubrobacteraceae bacterium]